MALAAMDLMQIVGDDHKTDFASKLRDEQLELTRNRCGYFAGQCRQVVQSGVSPLSCGCQPDPHGDHEPRDD